MSDNRQSPSLSGQIFSWHFVKVNVKSRSFKSKKGEMRENNINEKKRETVEKVNFDW